MFSPFGYSVVVYVTFYIYWSIASSNKIMTRTQSALMYNSLVVIDFGIYLLSRNSVIVKSGQSK